MEMRVRVPMVFLIFRNADPPAGLAPAKPTADVATSTEETRDATTSTQDSPATLPVGILSIHGFISSETVEETER